eukprot:gene4373-27118_t
MLRLLRRSVPITSIGRLGERGTALPAAAATVAAARLCETQRRGVSTSTLLHHQYKTPAQQHAWQQVSDGSKRAIKEVMGHSALTQVQADTLPLSLSGSNVLAKAKTGTGKTLAFLLPAVERALQSSSRNVRAGQGMNVLVIAPARELAQQVAEEAQDLLTFHQVTGD